MRRPSSGHASRRRGRSPRRVLKVDQGPPRVVHPTTSRRHGLALGTGEQRPRASVLREGGLAFRRGQRTDAIGVSLVNEVRYERMLQIRTVTYF